MPARHAGEFRRADFWLHWPDRWRCFAVNFLTLLERKRDGQPLTSAQISDLVQAYTNGQIPDYQMAAFLMAVYFRGLSSAETAALTLAMRDSGERLEFPSDSRPLVDKHSTGGVGDKISLPLAPLLAALGFRVPMISGRGLGITGGTLDKLDSIPGFQTALPRERILQIVQETGCIICGQTEHMVPADKRLYALRDVTGTVPSMPLIVASILSKKLAENLQALVLDVKFGAAAFMPGVEPARELARAMVDLGTKCGVHTRALLTRMDAPLGRAAGNWIEVRESWQCLQGKGPDDVLELVCACAAHLLVQTGRANSFETGVDLARRCMDSGAPREKWDEMLQAQGADLDAFRKKVALEHSADEVLDIKAPRSGFVAECNARPVGEVVRALGGGRLTKDSVLDFEAGVEILARPGEPVRAGEVLARIHGSDRTVLQTAAARLASAFRFSDESPPIRPLIEETIA